MHGHGIRDWGRYLGGGSEEYTVTTKLHPNGGLALIMSTRSGMLSTDGSVVSGNYDTLIARIADDGALTWATYFGGTADDLAGGLAVGPDGQIYALAVTSSKNLATPGAYQSALLSGQDGVMLQLSPAGVHGWSSYFGGNHEDSVTAGVYGGGLSIVGNTKSTTNVAALVAHQLTLGGGQDGFIAKFFTQPLPQPDGTPCADVATCQSGLCVDGVCCDATCGDGSPNDCQACSTAEGAAVDGTCGPKAKNAECRPAMGVCDAAESCDGVALACPPDKPAPDGTDCPDGECSAGVCDLAALDHVVAALRRRRAVRLTAVSRPSTPRVSCEPSAVNRSALSPACRPAPGARGAAGASRPSRRCTRSRPPATAGACPPNTSTRTPSCCGSARRATRRGRGPGRPRRLVAPAVRVGRERRPPALRGQGQALKAPGTARARIDAGARPHGPTTMDPAADLAETGPRSSRGRQRMRTTERSTRGEQHTARDRADAPTVAEGSRTDGDRIAGGRRAARIRGVDQLLAVQATQGNRRALGLVQRRRGSAGPGAETATQIHAGAQQGTRGPGGSLPHLARIQRSFGRHDVSTIRAHTDRHAAEGARAMGAIAFATGDHVAFAGTPSLHTAAHEAAHVIQQRGGVGLARAGADAGGARRRPPPRAARGRRP